MPMTIFNRDKRFISMHSVEFRLLPDYPFPAQLQDGVSVYINLLRRGVPAKHIVLMGDSSGANIALSLARWVRDTIQEGKGEERVTVKDGEQVSWRLADPGGLILFSVSQVLVTDRIPNIELHCILLHSLGSILVSCSLFIICAPSFTNVLRTL